MSGLVPNRFLFKFELSILRCSKPPPLKGEVSGWDDRYRLPALHSLEGEPGFGDVYLAWNDDGLYFGCEVGGKSRPPSCNPQDFRKGDNLRLLTDMRDTRTIRRATRFCQHFYFLPTGGGGKGRDPIAGTVPVNRAQQDAPQAKAGDIPVAAAIHRTGWTLTVHIPAAVLSGFDPSENQRIGLFYMLEDTELGQQSLTVGDDLNWWVDPSTWATAVLVET